MPRKTKTTPPKKSPSASNTIPPACPYCAGKDVVKSGKRYKGFLAQTVKNMQ
jgi:hypothetical protein